jgi:hypothetical protein
MGADCVCVPVTLYPDALGRGGLSQLRALFFSCGGGGFLEVKREYLIVEFEFSGYHLANAARYDLEGF